MEGLGRAGGAWADFRANICCRWESLRSMPQRTKMMMVSIKPKMRPRATTVPDGKGGSGSDGETANSAVAWLRDGQIKARSAAAMRGAVLTLKCGWGFLAVEICRVSDVLFMGLFVCCCFVGEGRGIREKRLDAGGCVIHHVNSKTAPL